MFSIKKQEFDEIAMNDFWIWFKNNQSNNILQIVKEMQSKFDKICPQNAWFDLGFDSNRNKGSIVFWADGSRNSRKCIERLVALAPSDINENWTLRVEN